MRAAAVLILLVALGAASAHAGELDSPGDAPRVFSIQPRPYRLGHEFQLGLGVLPTDAFYVGAVADASYTYHFSDFWAWEIANVGYSLNFGTGLRKQLREDYGVEPVGGGGERIHLFGTTSLVVKPLFGKLALFNRSVVYSETFFSAGLGALLLGEFVRPTVVLGLGLRFWSTPSLCWRIDVRDYLIFARWVPSNALFLMISASFNFFNDKAAEEQR